MALITTPKGLPIAYKVFPGNTQETKTLIPTINELKKEFSVKTIDFAADRGMFSESNLKELEKNEINYVVAAKLKTMSQKNKDSILEIKKDVSKNDIFRTRNLEYKGRRLVVCYSPRRAYKDRKDRGRLVERVKKIADKEGNVELKKLINNNGTKKYLKFEGQKKK